MRAGTLPLRELRRLARLVEARLLALDDACVARQEAGALQRLAKLRIRFHERARDAVAHGACLPARPAAVHAHADVVAAFETRDLERRERSLPVDGAREVVLDHAAVEPRRPVAGAKDHAGDGRLALAGAVVLRDRAHLLSSGSGFGVCASCGCSGPA